MSVKLVLLKTNGLSSSYQQTTATLSRDLVSRLSPRGLFTQGQLILGTGNPYTLVNPAHIACVQVDTQLPLQSTYPPGVESATQIGDKAAFMTKLDQRWSKWRKISTGGPGNLFEALIHLELAGGWEQYVHAIGRFPDRATESKVTETLLSMPVLCVQRPQNGMNYVNPEAIVRARIYHSNNDPFRPARLLPVDPDEI